MNYLINALEFLTIFSFPGNRSQEIDQIGKSSVCFPLVGLILGLILAGIDWLCSNLLPKEILNAILILILAILTRGIHLDGLADTADAFWGGSDREQKLQILRDSAIGSFGTIAIFFALLFKFVLLNSLPVYTKTATLILMLTTSRWSLVIMSFFGKPAQSDGLGQIFAQNTGYKQIFPATLITLIICLICWGFPSLILLIAIFILSFILMMYASRQIGGITGDVLGTCAELSEILCLAIVYTLAQII